MVGLALLCGVAHALLTYCLHVEVRRAERAVFGHAGTPDFAARFSLVFLADSPRAMRCSERGPRGRDRKRDVVSRMVQDGMHTGTIHDTMVVAWYCGVGTWSLCIWSCLAFCISFRMLNVFLLERLRVDAWSLSSSSTNLLLPSSPLPMMLCPCG